MVAASTCPLAIPCRSPASGRGRPTRPRPVVTMSSGVLRSTSRTSWCTPPHTGSRPSDLWSLGSSHLCQVSRGAGEAGAGGVVVDVAGDGGYGGSQFGGCLGLVGGGERDQ